MQHLDITDHVYRVTLCAKQAQSLKDALLFASEVLLRRYLMSMPGIDKVNHDAFLALIKTADLPVKEAAINTVTNKLAKADKLIGGRVGMTVTASELIAMSFVCEAYARLTLKQYDFASMLYPDAASQVEEMVSQGRLRDPERFAKRMSRLGFDDAGRHNQAFHAHRVFRHRISWDRAGSPGERDWVCMMGVSFDDPLTSSHNPEVDGVVTVKRLSEAF